MSRDSKGPRKTFSKGGSTDFNKRKSFSSSEKPKRTYGSDKPSFKRSGDDSTEKRSYTKREDSESRPRKSYGDSSEKKPYVKRADGKYESAGPRKSFGDGEKRAYTKRDDNDGPRKSYGDGEKRSYTKRDDSDGPRKSFGVGEKRSYTKREDSAGPRKSYGDGEKRSYTKRDDSDGPRKSYGDGEKRSYTKREGSDGESRAFVKRADGKYESAGRSPKSFEGAEKRSYTKREDSEKRPRKTFDDGDSKPFVKRADGKYESAKPRKSFEDGEKRSYAKKEDGEKRSYVRKDDGEKRSYTKRDGDEKKAYVPKMSKTEKVVEKSKKAGPKKTSDQPNVSDDAIRLNRYVANAGVCSRREADVLIATGVVTVNGKIVTEMGYKVNPGDVVNYGGVPIKNETKKYLLLNKPKDYITTMDDPEERRTVLELIKKACKERLYPVGRLDRNTTGVLLFTNDGDMTAKLTHPKFDVRKVYHVTLNKKMAPEDYQMLNEGFELADGFIKPDATDFVGAGRFELGVEIHSGRNRIVRRMFEHLGYEVVKLDRVAFAGLTKKDLPRGKHRFLTEKEVAFLKMLG